MTPTASSTRTLDAVILVDRSGSMNGAGIFDTNDTPRTKHQVLVAGLKAAAKKTLNKDDRVQLWEFADRPRKIGSGDGDQLARLADQLAPPDGGTEIGLALSSAAENSESPDFLMITDGNSYRLDVQTLARNGKRFHVVLIGEDSLEANVGTPAI